MQVSLRALRINAGLSQKEAAQRIGVTPVTLGKWERYETFPKAHQFIMISHVYKCAVDDIFIPN